MISSLPSNSDELFLSIRYCFLQAASIFNNWFVILGLDFRIFLPFDLFICLFVLTKGFYHNPLFCKWFCYAYEISSIGSGIIYQYDNLGSCTTGSEGYYLLFLTFGDSILFYLLEFLSLFLIFNTEVFVKNFLFCFN